MGLSHSMAGPVEWASSGPRNYKKQGKENWRLLNFVLWKLEESSGEISSRWEPYNFPYKPKIECSGSPALWANHSKRQRWLVTLLTCSGLHSFPHWNVVYQLPKTGLWSGDWERGGLGERIVYTNLKDWLLFIIKGKANVLKKTYQDLRALPILSFCPDPASPFLSLTLAILFAGLWTCQAFSFPWTAFSRIVTWLLPSSLSWVGFTHSYTLFSSFSVFHSTFHLVSSIFNSYLVYCVSPY